MIEEQEVSTVRVTLHVNYQLHGRPHHPDEIIEAINSAFPPASLKSDYTTSNPRWELHEQYRDLRLTG